MLLCAVTCVLLLAAPKDPPLTREKLTELYSKQDPYCGTRDPWAMFVHRTKTPEELALLTAWANEDAAPPALAALSNVADPSLVPFWRARIAKFAKGSGDRNLAVLALLTAGGDTVVDEAYASLGESERLDIALLTTAWNSRSERAVRSLRAYQRSKKAPPAVQAELTRKLFTLDPAHAEGDEDALLASKEERDLGAVLDSSEVSAPRLEKLLPLLARDGRHQTEAADQIAFGLFHMLEKSEPAAVQLAERWSSPSPETAKLLARAPSITLVLALWRQSRNELTLARSIFERGLASPPTAPVPSQRYHMESPQVGYAALLIHHACLLESTGQRADALKQFKAYDAWSEPVQHDTQNLLDNLAFRSYSPYWCYRGTDAASLSAMPLVLTATRVRSKSGYRITAELWNASTQPVKVKTCPVAGGGLPAESLWVNLGGSSLEVPSMRCQRKTRTLAPDARVSGTFEATARPGKLEQGLMRVTLRPALVPEPKDADELNFVFAESNE